MILFEIFFSGGLLQQFNRDTMKFAIKCSHLEMESGEMIPVFKDPITDPGKRNKAGRLKLILNSSGKYQTVNNIEQKSIFEQSQDQLITVFENGKLIQDYSLENIRRNCDIHEDQLDSMLMIKIDQ